LPAYVFYLLFYFISSFLISVSDFVLKKFFGTDQIQLYFSKVELGNYITEQMSSVEDDDDGFRNTNVSECVRILRGEGEIL
jgi:hypothetical protein